MPGIPRIALFTRYPTPGTAKTRLIPALGADGAAAMHRRLVERTLATVRASGLPFDLRVTGAARERFADWLGNDIPLVDQGEGDLGARLARVAAPMILIGGDAPDVSARHLRAAAMALADAPAVIGPAIDGGYWLLGLREPMPFLFEAMPWGSDAVFAETIARLGARDIEPVRLETLADLDRPEDLARWPELSP